MKWLGFIALVLIESLAIFGLSLEQIGFTVPQAILISCYVVLLIITITGDTQTLAAKQKIHREGKSIVGVGTVKFSEFVLVDEYSIVGVWIESPAVNN